MCPKATVNSAYVEKHMLTTCPPDGFVELRRMTYHEYLTRRDMAARMTMNFRGKGNVQEDTEAVMAIANAAITEYEFKNCIVNHNLTNENDEELDFRSSAVFHILDPRIGEEISSLIETMNNFDAGNSKPGSVPRSS